MHKASAIARIGVFFALVKSHSIQTIPIADKLTISLINQPFGLGLFKFQDKACHKSVTKSVDGVKVGIIGYVTPKTEFISKPGFAPFLLF